MSFPRAIIFDVDGTLVDDESAVDAALAKFHTLYGEPLALSEQEIAGRWKRLLELHFGRYLTGEISLQEQRRARIRDLFAQSMPTIRDEEADQIFGIYEQSYRAAWAAFPDAASSLSCLRPYRLAVLTNGDLIQQTQKLQTAGLSGFFRRSIFASSEIGFAKPRPEAFTRVCQRLDLPPQRCAYVGDNLSTDALASASAGLMSFWLDRRTCGAKPPEGIRQIHSLSELSSLVG
jgi:putative hydrolase of the HAD superfamily